MTSPNKDPQSREELEIATLRAAWDWIRDNVAEGEDHLVVESMEKTLEEMLRHYTPGTFTLLALAVEREATEGDSVAGGLIRMADNHGLLAKERELLYHAARLLRGGETNPARVREREEAGDE